MCKLAPQETIIGVRAISFLAVLAFFVCPIVTCSAAVSLEVTPANLENLPFQFSIHSERLPTGDNQFRVTVTEKHSHFTHFGYVALCTVTITPNGEYAHEYRRLQDDRKDHSRTYIFTVTEKELQVPDLCYYFLKGDETMSQGKIFPMGSGEVFYARLLKFVKP